MNIFFVPLHSEKEVYMETQILKLEAPYDYIYCNGEVGKHIATYIVGESRINEEGKYELETQSPYRAIFKLAKGRGMESCRADGLRSALQRG